MNKKLSFSLLMILCLTCLHAQESFTDLVVNQQGLQKNAMVVLGGWGAINAVAGGIGVATSDGVAKHFHQMNMGWGVINAGIAAFGYYGAMNFDLADPISISLLDKNFSLSKALLFNAGLDLGYVATGFYLRERSKNAANSDRMLGFGNSLVMQGAFLFIFDLSVHFINSKLADRIQDQIISVGSTEHGVGLLLSF